MQGHRQVCACPGRAGLERTWGCKNSPNLEGTGDRGIPGRSDSVGLWRETGDSPGRAGERLGNEAIYLEQLLPFRPTWETAILRAKQREGGMERKESFELLKSLPDGTNYWRVSKDALKYQTTCTFSIQKCKSYKTPFQPGMPVTL